MLTVRSWHLAVGEAEAAWEGATLRLPPEAMRHKQARQKHGLNLGAGLSPDKEYKRCHEKLCCVTA